jgi:HEAT repeat protein
MQVRDAARSVLLVLSSGLFPVLAGCASTAGETSPAADAAGKSTAPEHPIAQIVEATNKPEPIGMLLVTLDQEITAWNNLFLMAQTEVERSKARNLEKTIMTTAYNRRGELIEQLESGPLNNRIVAAAALGFTRDPSVQSPLLAALDDQQPEVVSSALIGLWLLGRADTPLDRIAARLTAGETEDVRTNAALCLSALVRAGARGESAQPALRIGMLDRAATVRAHCALALAELGDTDSFQAIADMLNEDTALSIAAGARAISFMAKQDPKLRGKAARALVSAWMRAEEPAKSSLFRSMVELSGTNYGTDEEEWSKWATRLP